MSKLSRSELAQALVARHGIEKKKALQFVDAFVAVTINALTTDRIVKIKGLGTFKVVEVESRESINVNTGERLIIDGHSKLAFLPEASMKELVNRPFSQFDTVILNEGVDFSEMEGTTDDTLSENVFDEEPDDEEEMDVVAATSSADYAISSVSDTNDSAVDEVSETEDSTADEVSETEDSTADEVSETEDSTADEVSETEDSTADEVSETEDSTADEVSETEDSTADEVSETEDSTADEVNETDDSDADEVSETDDSDADEESETDDSDADEGETFSEEVNYNEERTRAAWKWWLPISLLALAVGFGAGFLTGRSTMPTSEPQPAEQPQATQTTQAQQPTAQTATPTPADSVTEASTPIADTPTQADTAEQAQPAPELPATETDPRATAAREPEWEKYNKMSVRTREGAYYIMGFNRMEKVRQGDDLKRIARRVFGGEDMACYIEVYNGINSSTQLQPGSEIKIPKIELKKIVRKRLQQQQNQ
jgi:nucleoid DNA-binding protein